MKEAAIRRDRVSYARNYLEPSLDKRLVEMTQPDSPNSPTQKYRLSEKGKLILKQVNDLIFPFSFKLSAFCSFYLDFKTG